jgi:general nucleoside transport system permease protein
MNDALVVIIAAQAVTAAVPLILAGVGETVAQRAGVLNVGIEGLLLTGCIAGFLGAVLSGSAWIGLIAAIVAGASLAAVFAWVTVVMQCDQIVAGMAINLLAIGGSGTAWSVAQANGYAELPAVAGFSRGAIPFVSPATHAWLVDLPLVGPLMLDQYAIVWAVLIIAVGMWWILRSTRIGVVVQALGDAPDACAAQGINVWRWRMLVVIFAGALAGGAGAYLSIMRTHGFSSLMTGGMGFVILALVIFGRWRIGGIVLAALGFGVIEGIQSHLQSRGLTTAVPYQVFQALPFVVALMALAMMRRGTSGPQMLGIPWPSPR